MPSVCFATIRLQRSWERSLLLPIMICFLCDTLVMRHLFIGHQLGLNQLILICTDKGPDCFLITDRFQLFAPPFLHVFNTFPICAFSLWFYDRSARLNSFFTYVKYITLHYLLYGYHRHIIKVSTNISVMTNNEKAKVMRSTQCVRDCTIWDEAQLVAASPRESPFCLNRTWSNSAILIIKMIEIIRKI